MRYIPPFDALKAHVNISKVKSKPTSRVRGKQTPNAQGAQTVSCSFDEFVTMLRRLIADVQVDESWYLNRYQDVAEGIGKGTVGTAKSHFVLDGYFEGRLPFPIRVDETYYLEQNEGVADHVRQGLLKSGQEHFDEHGYAEGRLPFCL